MSTTPSPTDASGGAEGTIGPDGDFECKGGGCDWWEEAKKPPVDYECRGGGCDFWEDPVLYLEAEEKSSPSVQDDGSLQCSAGQWQCGAWGDPHVSGFGAHAGTAPSISSQGAGSFIMAMNKERTFVVEACHKSVNRKASVVVGYAARTPWGNMKFVPGSGWKLTADFGTIIQD